MNNVEIRRNALGAEEFLRLFTAVGWDAPGTDQVEMALANSLATFAAVSGADVVGMVRLIGDGGMSFYIKDFAVMPAAQSQGVGSALLAAVEGYVRESMRPGWAVSLELISSQGAVAFYERHGFEPRPNEWDGPGMLKMIRA
ncbi:GNAT family N-acetyltransferase [Bifidobacterium sp. AGR2158]|uniref:GNAT family N-acetyltransferase n=1 Tax=Bifidobacterium sp. AGR2158 TaxID=1280675 RepID=UPI000424E580|nr:GNAT family N-acetyltransferase [Bifidobacterium sp. AGR2158]